MAVYEELLLESGGGIVNCNQLADRIEEGSLFIGIGSTGAKAVAKIKQDIYNNLKPDDWYDVVPQYGNIKFLILDSNPEDCTIPYNVPWRLDLQTEGLEIKDRSGLSNDAAAIVERSKEILMTLLTELAEKRRNCNTKIHICAGLGDETGGEIFLDVCYLVRRVIDELKLDRLTKVIGYFFLTDNHCLSLFQQSEDLRRGNSSYAALRELDHCMNFNNNGDSFRKDYGQGVVIDDNRMPVDVCFLLSAMQADGRILSPQQLMEKLSEFILVQLTQMDNCTSDIFLSVHDMVNWTPKCSDGVTRAYSVPGVGVQRIPFQELNTLIGVQLFQCFRPIYDRIPMEGDAKLFLTNLQLTYDDILRELAKDCTSMNRFLDKINYKFYRERGEASFQNIIQEQLNQKINILEHNEHAMEEDLDGSDLCDISKKGNSPIHRIAKALYEEYVLKMEFGPVYAMRLVSGYQNGGIVHVIDEYILMNHIRIQEAAHMENEYRNRLEDAKVRLAAANFLNSNSRMEQFKGELDSYIHHTIARNVFERMDIFLHVLREQVCKLNDIYLRKIVCCMDNLRETFEENNGVLHHRMNCNGGSVESILYKCNQIIDIQKNYPIPQIYTGLMRELVTHVGKINGTMEENPRMGGLMSDFIVDIFAEANWNMDDVHNMIDSATPALLPAINIADDSNADSLWDMAVPLFKPILIKHNQVESRNVVVPLQSNLFPISVYEFEQKYGGIIHRARMEDRVVVIRIQRDLSLEDFVGLACDL